MRGSILLGLALLQIMIFGQSVMAQENFIYLFDGTQVKSRIVDIRDPFTKKSYFIADSGRYSAELVKFYSNENGFFANTRRLNFSGSSIFISRVIVGKVNLYERVKLHATPGNFGTNGVYSPGATGVTIKNYYNIGFGDLRKATYKNLAMDLGDNPESMKNLAKYHNYTRVQTVMSIIGGALIASGIISYYIKTKDVNYDDPNHKDPDVKPSIGFIVAGAGCIGVSYYISFPKRDRLKRVVENYNWN
ncbi:MAG: hypothetical protein EHM93_12275 [Bacteroidales bacterium]|nr:MAG: hypothetical protein EHM93_12275 [Bacteroidales bacterium]